MSWFDKRTYEPLSVDSKMKLAKVLDRIYAHLVGYQKIDDYGILEEGKSRNSNQPKF